MTAGNDRIGHFGGQVHRWSGTGHPADTTPKPDVSQLIDTMEQFREAVRRMSDAFAECVRVLDGENGTPCPRRDAGIGHDRHNFGPVGGICPGH